MKRFPAVAATTLLFAGLALGAAQIARADDIGALITLTAHTAGTVNSTDQDNSRLNAKTVSCVLNQSAHTNTPSTTITIQGKDAATGKYYSLITSSAVTTSDDTPVAVAAGVGVATTANVGAGFPIPAKWRVIATIGGTTPIVTGKVACNRSF